MAKFVKSKKQLITEYLQLKGFSVDFNSIRRYSDLSVDTLAQQLESLGGTRYIEKEDDGLNDYCLKFRNGTTVNIRAKTPKDAVKSYYKKDIMFETVSRYDWKYGKIGDVEVILENSLKKSINLYKITEKPVSQSKEKTKPRPKTPYDLTKEQKAYQDNLRKTVATLYGAGKFDKWFYDNTAYVVVLGNGDYHCIHKPGIETHFCFNSDHCDAHALYDTTRTKPDYFIQENMKPLLEKINVLEGKTNKKYLYKRQAYNKIDLLKNIKAFVVPIESCDDLDIRVDGRIEDYILLSEKERQDLLYGYKVVAVAMKQRLDTYLKKYGLSKLHVWTYCDD